MNNSIDITLIQKGVKFLEDDSVLGSYIQKLSMPNYKLDRDYFKSLCKYIIFQQLSVKSASRTFARFKKLLQDVKPTILLNTNDDDLKNTGLSFRKVNYLKELSQSFIKNDNYKNLINKSDQEIVKSLTKIKGIGSWTAEMFLIFTLGRIDVFSTKDIGLLNGLKLVYNLNNRPTFENAELLSKRWSPYRTIASLYLWKIIEGEDFDW